LKLIYCKNCGDIYSLGGTVKSCSCGKTRGVYIDTENAIYGGDNAICLGIDNNAFEASRNRQRLDGYGVRFDSYICALHCNSTIKIKNLEKISENELYRLLSKYNFSKIWNKKVDQRRYGLTKWLYSLCRKIMNIEINKLDKSYLDPELDKWYSNFTDRVLSIAKRLATVTGKNSEMRWFNILISFLLDNPEDIMKFEKIEDNLKLYKKVYKRINKYYQDQYIEKEEIADKESLDKKQDMAYD
jgi:hypothetical protein